MLSSHIEGNRILSTLAAREPGHPILKRLVPISLAPSQVLVTAFAAVQYGFFITKGMGCGATVMKNGVTTADELIGPEGFVGLSLLFGSTRMQPVTVIAKVAGTAMKIDANVFLQEFDKAGIFRDVMRRYTFSRVASMIQTAACNTVHCIQERMACCLLRTSDRLGTDFKLTHEAMAQILGNRRATVTTQLEAFKRMGLISSGYGRIRIENRRELEKRACECYEIHKKAVDSVFKLSN